MSVAEIPSDVRRAAQGPYSVPDGLPLRLLAVDVPTHATAAYDPDSKQIDISFQYADEFTPSPDDLGVLSGQRSDGNVSFEIRIHPSTNRIYSLRIWGLAPSPSEVKNLLDGMRTMVGDLQNQEILPRHRTIGLEAPLQILERSLLHALLSSDEGGTGG